MTGFLLIATLLVCLMAGFILTILFLYRNKQIAYEEKIINIQANYEKTLLKTKLEIQEQTFQNISREIHDNISLSLTLAKLHLNTLNWAETEKTEEKVATSIELLTNSIAELSDISKSLNADIIIQHGLLKAIDDELHHIRQIDLFSIDFELSGSPIYMDNQKELIIFRIIQESFNNIIKHAQAQHTKLILHYEMATLIITITDDGMGFDTKLLGVNRQAGLKNMETRIKILKGEMHINSKHGKGTVLVFKIPYE